MEYRRLGNSGLKMSALSFGSWITFSNQLDDKLATQCMSMAYEHGINFFDNAEVYAQGESELQMGRVIKALRWSRDTYTVSSKVFWGGKLPTQNGLSRKHVIEACHAALRRFQLEYLDLYYCHRPDPDTPIEETVWAMNDLIRQGKVLYWGTSVWSADQIKEAHEFCKAYKLIPPTMEQPEYNLFRREKVESEYAPLYKSVGLGLTTYSPLSGGILSGKYDNGIPQDSRFAAPENAWLVDRVTSPEGKSRIEKTKALAMIATELGIKTAQLAIAWCLKNPHVSSVILGASKPAQLEENLKALDASSLLTSDVMKKIERVL